MANQNDINPDIWKPKNRWLITESLHIGVGKALFLWFMALSFIPLATVSYINYLNSFKGLTEVAQKSLTTSSKLRSENLNNYFEDITNLL